LATGRLAIWLFGARTLADALPAASAARTLLPRPGRPSRLPSPAARLRCLAPTQASPDHGYRHREQNRYECGERMGPQKSTHQRYQCAGIENHPGREDQDRQY
jgi:hypothetical protein